MPLLPTLEQRATFLAWGGEVAEASVSMCPPFCPQNDEEAMVEAVALHNPVSFAFEVTADFMMYRKGIYSR